MKSSNLKSLKKLTTISMLTAIAVALQYIEIPIPIMPSFIKLDFSDLPEIIASFLFGPISGVLVAFLKNLIHLFASQTGFIGELSNFLIAASFCIPAGLIYKKKKTLKCAIIAGIVGCLVSGIISLPINYFIIYPLYYNVMGFPEKAILDMYQLILPKVKNIFEALLIFNVPFTIAKNLVCTLFTLVIYKPLKKVNKEF